MAYNNGPRIITDGLVLALDAANPKSYPGSGTTWTDLSGNGNNGTLTNGPTFDSEVGGNIVFDGLNDYMSTGNTFDESPINGFFAEATARWSVSSWFKPNTSNTTNGAVFSKANGVGASATMIVWEAGTTLNARIRGGTILEITTTMTTAWHQVVLTWDGTTASAYYDGNFVNTISAGTAAIQNSFLGVGASQIGTIPNNFMLGSAADLKVYNRAISNEEVLQNYNATRTRFGV